MAWIIVYMMTRYLRTGSDIHRNMARFWIKLFGLSFVVGVASGITMEFQFGTNWANYSRFVGDIFGAPLAAEAVIAFFLESTFLGVLLLGWNRVSPKVHWFASLMVAVGSTLSAFWILVANSWQQTPAGYHVVNGRAELTSFYEAVMNPSMLPRFLHTMDAAMITGALFMLGVSGWFLLRNKHAEFAKESLKIALVVGFAASVIQLPLGHYHAVQVAHTQPAKLAAFEGLFTTQTNAPALVFGIIRPDENKVEPAIRLPGLLSLMAYGNMGAKVTGLDAFPRDEWPPIEITFYSFHAMVMLGMYFIGFTALGILLLWRGMLFENKLYLKLALVSIPLPFITNELGWIAAEVGRQPWIVYNILKTRDAISVTVPAAQILITIIMFSLIYALLFVAWVMVLKREMRKGPERAGLQIRDDQREEVVNP
jgi:cytochrome d ubiquinol oxidase subunit I